MLLESAKHIPTKKSSPRSFGVVSIVFLIFASPRANKFKVIDLTHSLNAKKGQIFADWHHLNSKGNKIVAEALKGLLNRILVLFGYFFLYSTIQV